MPSTLPDLEARVGSPASEASEIHCKSSPGDASEEPSPDFEKATDLLKADDWLSSPENPYNWPKPRRLYAATIPAVFSFICTFGSSVYSPGIESVTETFQVSTEAAELGLSLYVLGLAFGPCIAAPLSETFGRRIVYISTFLISCLFTLGAGFSQTFSALLACRFFAGFFAGPALSVGSGSIADVFPPIDRAALIALFTGSAFIGPTVGPIIGGFVAENKGWRWTQWLILFWAALGIAYIAPMRETHKATILKKLEKRRSKSDQSFNADLTRTTSAVSRDAARQGFHEIRKTVTVTLLRPIRMLFTEPIVAAFSVYIAFNFGIFYGFFGAWPLIFQGVYGFNLGIFGLTWIGLFVGIVIGVCIIIICDRKIYRPRALRAQAEGRKGGIAPENRLYPAMYASAGIPLALFWVGWTSRTSIHWICPIIGSAFFTIGNICVFVSGILYLADTYGAKASASAGAANGLLRYVAGTAFPLFSRQMFTGLGIGWATSLLGFISVALCFVPYVLFHYGPRLRAMSGRQELGS